MNNRLYSLDYLKVALTILVVAHHAGQPYGGSGGFWYFENEGSPIDLGIFFSTNAAFFMSLFFFISAYFMPASYDRKGAPQFVLERVKRFGLPLLLGFLIMVPLLMYAYYISFRGYPTIGFWNYYTEVYFGLGGMPSDWTGPSWPDMQFAHLWFLQHLLVYTVIYALFKYVLNRRQRGHHTDRTYSPLRTHHIILFAVLVALMTYMVRIWYPIDHWTGFLGFIQTEFAHVPQYAAMFLAGIAAARRNWLRTLPFRTGLLWLLIGLIITVCRYTGLITVYTVGGRGITSFLYAILETFLCVSLCIGLTWLFYKLFNQSNSFADKLSSAAYGVYIIHVPVLVALQYSLAKIEAPVSVKLGLVIIAGTALSFLISVGYVRIVGWIVKKERMLSR